MLIIQKKEHKKFAKWLDLRGRFGYNKFNKCGDVRGQSISAELWFEGAFLNGAEDSNTLAKDSITI